MDKEDMDVEERGGETFRASVSSPTTRSLLPKQQR